MDVCLWVHIHRWRRVVSPCCDTPMPSVYVDLIPSNTMHKLQHRPPTQRVQRSRRKSSAKRQPAHEICSYFRFSIDRTRLLLLVHPSFSLHVVHLASNHRNLSRVRALSCSLRHGRGSVTPRPPPGLFIAFCLSLTKLAGA